MTSKKKLQRQPKSTTKEEAAFSRHSEQQKQLQSSTAAAATTAANNTNNATQRNNNGGDFGQMSLTARLLVFIIVPLLTGFIGLAASYLQSTRPPPDDNDGKQQQHTVDFDRDFVTPALLGLAFVIIIGFQTGGFRIIGGQGEEREGGERRRYALSWPKARRVRKVRREIVIVEDDNDNDDNGDGAGEGSSVKDTKKER